MGGIGTFSIVVASRVIMMLYLMMQRYSCTYEAKLMSFIPLDVSHPHQVEGKQLGLPTCSICFLYFVDWCPEGMFAPAWLAGMSQICLGSCCQVLSFMHCRVFVFEFLFFVVENLLREFGLWFHERLKIERFAPFYWGHGSHK